MNRYKYALVDMSYILVRNLKAISAGKQVGEYNEGEVLRITIQTIKKIVRDYGITADKYIFIMINGIKKLTVIIEHTA